MRALLRSLLLSVCAGCICLAADIPHLPQQGSTVREIGQPLYYWSTSPVGSTAQLVTLFCRGCDTSGDAAKDVPLVAVLRDTLGDNDPDNDRLIYVWLLSYSRLSVTQRILSAVPFFYWRVGEGSKVEGSKDTKPLLDLTAPANPVLPEIGRDVLQWTMLDPMTTPVRATSRAYRTNSIDHQRLHLEEAAGYLRAAPAPSDPSGLTESELNTVLARLELRKRLLGGLVTDRSAARFGEQASFEQERIRSRNWELLRECAERTGLMFEPLKLSGTTDQYAMLWFPRGATLQDSGVKLDAIWKLLDIRNPWTDSRIQHWQGPVYERAAEFADSSIPAAQNGNADLIPLAVYSLNYPKTPLLMVDFRDKLHVRWHAMAQRSINEITSGVIGLSHFTNWYYYVAADLYDFVVSRHGSAMNQAERLDCYSEFRVQLALDHELYPRLRKDMQDRVNSLAMNPLEAAPQREIQNARHRYEQLEAESELDGELISKVEKQRRSELASFGETAGQRMRATLMNHATFGLYAHRVKQDELDLAALDSFRRVQHHVDFLDELVRAGTPPEVAFDSAKIRTSVAELSRLMPRVSSERVRQHVGATLGKLAELSRDADVKTDCSLALASLERETPKSRVGTAPGVATSTHGVSVRGAASLQ